MQNSKWQQKYIDKEPLPPEFYSDDGIAPKTCPPDVHPVEHHEKPELFEAMSYSIIHTYLRRSWTVNYNDNTTYSSNDFK